MKTPDDWIVPDWPAPARVKSLITTRNGGASTGAYATFNLGLRCGDDANAVNENRRQLRALLPQDPRWLRQVHGAHAVVADDLEAVVEADAAVARRPDTVCAVLIADCMPILLCDDDTQVVAIAHAGWRGLSSGVIENCVRAMEIDPKRVIAYLGPAIGPDAFEVGADVHDAFVACDAAAATAFRPHREDKWLADLGLLARQRLAGCGVKRVYGGRMCTYRDARRFYSYRRDRTTGRMAALIWLAPR